MPCLLDCPGLRVQDPESLVLGDCEQRGARFIKLDTPQVLLRDLQLLLQLIGLVGITALSKVKTLLQNMYKYPVKGYNQVRYYLVNQS